MGTGHHERSVTLVAVYALEIRATEPEPHVPGQDRPSTEAHRPHGVGGILHVDTCQTEGLSPGQF